MSWQERWLFVPERVGRRSSSYRTPGFVRCAGIPARARPKRRAALVGSIKRSLLRADGFASRCRVCKIACSVVAARLTRDFAHPTPLCLQQCLKWVQVRTNRRPRLHVRSYPDSGGPLKPPGGNHRRLPREVPLQALPAFEIVALEFRGLDGVTGEPHGEAALEHEGHGVFELVWL
jgi:hypothetical protein